MFKMQSSPPTRAWDRVEPRSPANDSEYSLDLGALDLDGGSNASSPVAKPKIDRVFSEDIDGPTDFTLNMEKWMRGGTLAKGTMRGQLGSIETRVHQDEKQDRQDDAVLDDPQSPQLHDEELTESHHTPHDTPPKESVWGTSLHDTADTGKHEGNEEHSSSNWDPYGQASTPQPTGHHQLLQPTVEDYQSELTPAHLSTIRVPDSLKTTDTLPRGRRTSPRQSEPSSPGRPSSPTLSPVRSPLMQRSAPQLQASSPMTEPALDRQLRMLQAKCQQLEHINSALKQALDDEQRIRKQENLAHQDQIIVAARHHREAMEIRDIAMAGKGQIRRDFSEYKAHTRSMEEEQLEAERQEKERLKEAHAIELHRLKDEWQQQKDEQAVRLSALENDLQIAYNAREDAEEAARVHREDFEEYRDSHEAALERLRLALGDARAAQATIADLESQLEKLKQQMFSLQSSKEATEEAASSVRAELVNVKQSQQDETVRITTGHLRAAELAEGLQQKLEELQQQMRDHEAAHQDELHKMRSSQDQAQRNTLAELDSLRTEHEAQQSLLNSAILERDASQDSFEAVQSELEALKADLADKAVVEKAFDARISDEIQKRELYWREKLRASEKERQMMAKALLHQWGKEEVGVETPQRYEFKFVTRKGGLQADV